MDESNKKDRYSINTMSDLIVSTQEERRFSIDAPGKYSTTRAFLVREEHRRVAELLKGDIPPLCFLLGGPKFGKSWLFDWLEGAPENSELIVGVLDLTSHIEKQSNTDAFDWLVEKIIGCLGQLITKVMDNAHDKATKLIVNSTESALDKVYTLRKRIRDEDFVLLAEELKRSIFSQSDELISTLESLKKTNGDLTYSRRIIETIEDASRELKRLTAFTANCLQGTEITIAVRSEIYALLKTTEVTLGSMSDQLPKLVADLRVQYIRNSLNRRDFQSLGDSFRQYKPETVKLVLALDDFDQFIETSGLSKNSFLELLSYLQSLQGGLRLVLSFRKNIDVFKEIDIHSQDVLSKKNLPTKLSDVFQMPVKEIILSVMKSEQIKQLINQVEPELPDYIAFMIYRETGGHPFLVQLFCSYCYNSLHNSEKPESLTGTNTVDWIGFDGWIDSQLNGKKQLRDFFDSLLEVLPRGLQELIAEGNKRSLNEQIGELPETISWKDKRFWMLPKLQEQRTTELIDSLIESPTLGELIIRKASGEEVNKPYCFQIGLLDASQRYVVTSRFIWHYLPKSPLRSERKPWLDDLPEFDIYQLTFLSLFFYMLLWWILELLERDTKWAIPAPILIVSYGLNRWLVYKLRSKIQNDILLFLLFSSMLAFVIFIIVILI